MNRDQIKQAVVEIYEKASRLFNLKNPSVPDVSFFSKSGTAGRAWYAEHRVEFNEILALENPETFMTTIAHEIAHLITDQLYPNAKQHHGPEFKYVMESLGYDPRTYHSYDVSSVSTRRVKIRYEYVCVECGKTYEVATPTHKKIMAVNAIGYFCTKCKSGIRFTGNTRSFV